MDVEFANGSGTAAFLSENGVAFASTTPALCRVERPVSFAIALGYDPAAVAAELARRSADPAAIFAEARAIWDYYFRALVPRLESSDANLERLYYYLFYVVRSSLYDIPYEPYSHPYTSPWKTGAIWQWAWNTGFNSIAERWLNDPSFCQQGMRLIARHGAAMNVGSYLRPLAPVRQPYTMWDWSELVDAAQIKLTIPDYDILFEQPYTVPNAFLGVWEVYQATGDKEFLRLNLPILEQYEKVARSKARPGSLITPLRFMFDEFDYSLRWKPVQKTFTKGGLQRGYDVPVDMVDMNAYLVELRRILAGAYRELGRPAEARAMDDLADRSAGELNRRLWDPDLRFYSDARSDTGASTRVRAVSGFSPLYAGIVPPKRKPALMAALDDPQGFAAPYAVPSIELRHPDLDPNMITYGGDSLAVSGVWTVTVALARNGEAARAARLLRSAIAMITKDGVSSAYSYNPITAKPNQRKHELTTQCAIVNDLICRYIAGFEPRADARFEFNPIALDQRLAHFRFGPYRYKSKYTIETEWNGREYIVKVNGRSLRSPRPRRIVAALGADGNLTEVR